MNRIAWLFCIGLAACPSSTPPSNGPAPTAPCDAFCGALARVGCPEGAPDAGCERVCETVQASRIVDLCSACVAAARSRDEVHACRDAQGHACAVGCTP